MPLLLPTPLLPPLELPTPLLLAPKPPSTEVSPHVLDPVPLTDCLVAPCVHSMVQLEPLTLDVHTTPSTASVPHRHIDVPFWLAVQHADALLLPEQP